MESERNEQSPDYAKGDPEDRASDAPSGKEALTEIDSELEEDQAALQTDSS